RMWSALRDALLYTTSRVVIHCSVLSENRCVVAALPFPLLLTVPVSLYSLTDTSRHPFARPRAIFFALAALGGLSTSCTKTNPTLVDPQITVGSIVINTPPGQLLPGPTLVLERGTHVQ